MSERELRLGFPGNERRATADVPEGTPVPWDLSTEHRILGKDHPRVDGRLKVTGRAKYSYDVRFEDLIHARMLRSPHASAIAKRVDLSKAKALPGVLFAKAYEGRVRYAGQHVAGIAAVSEEILADALALIDVEYEVLPHAATLDRAMEDGSARVTDDPNVQKPRISGNLAEVEAAHKEADVVVEAEYRTQVQTHSALETHGCVCKWDGDRLTVWASTQGTFSVRGDMAKALGVPAERITVITEHMGGGFGAKFGTRAWDVFCAEAARETGRPCRYLLDRREEHLVGGNRPDSIQRCRFSARKDGTFLGAEVRTWGTAGNGQGARVTNPAIYRFPKQYQEQHEVLTHAGEGRAFRAPGHPQGVFALEGMIDELAQKLDMDPLELRRKNDPHPVRRAQYDVGAKAIGWERRASSGSSKERVRRGLGMASAVWYHTGRAPYQVGCRIGKDGSVLVTSGAQDLGTGTRTVLAAVAAEELGLAVKDVEVRLGSTTDPEGPGSGGSTTAASLATPARLAAWQAKRELLRAVAAAVGGDAEAMDVKDGAVAGAPRPLAFRQACALLPTDMVESLGRSDTAHFQLPEFASGVAGVQFAEVEVDTETGAVRVLKVVAVQDCGLVVDPLLARSQINGGVIQGVSYALFENRLLDGPTGNMVNADFLSYKIAGALDMPEIVAIPFSVANGKSPTGVSALGEPPTVPTAGAIGNAVANALGVRVRSLPITPDKVLAALGAL